MLKEVYESGGDDQERAKQSLRTTWNRILQIDPWNKVRLLFQKNVFYFAGD